MTTERTSYETAFDDGLRAAVDLARAGATADDLAALLPADPARTDARGYSDHLGELRTILDVNGLFTGVTP